MDLVSEKKTMGIWDSLTGSKQADSKGEDVMSDATNIDFGEILDISFAAKLYTQLKEEVKANSTVNFITSGLTRIDASCLQVITSFMDYAKENEIKVHWDEPGDVVLEAARLTGLNQKLELE